MKPLIILLTMLFVACGGGGGSDGPTITGSGRFVDGPVQGLSYQTKSVSGKTDLNGGFKYVPGEDITFSYGGVDLGTAPATDLMTPWDLVKQDDLELAEQALINMLRLIQSLDQNEDHSDGVQLFDLSDIIINVSNINFNQGILAFEQDYNLRIYLTNILNSIILIDIQEAIRNFEDSLEEFEITIPIIINPDTDGDGVADSLDNCPLITNPNQENADGDTAGDACDAFPNAANETVDADGDSVGNNSDNCPIAANPDQENDDDDTLGNVCDTDDDNDGIADGADNCQTVANPNQENDDDDALGNACDTDDDNDGVEDNFPDNCPIAANPNQENDDNDALGNACDSDDDNDGVPDTEDNCSVRANADQLDTDDDGLGNSCDSDKDNDTRLDTADNCSLISNLDQLDTDGDLIGDACDSDDDNDTVLDAIPDNCLVISNLDQLDTDGDLIGDACDTDDDADSVNDVVDNCPLIVNTDQTNSDDDSQGNACDDDDDNDTYLDGNDAFPLDPFEWLDSDADTVGDNTDNCINDANADQSDVDVDGLGDICDNDNGVPVPVNDFVNIVANSSNNVIDVLANDDFGIDGAGIFTISVAVTNGVATIDDNATPDNAADDTIIYIPTTNYSGSDTLSYTITDASGSEASATVDIEVILELNTFNVSATNDPKILRFTWTGDGLSAGDHFSLQVDADGNSGFAAVAGGSNISNSETMFDLEIPIHLTDWVNAEYRLEVQSDDNSVLDSFDLNLVNEMTSIEPIGYFKASNTGPADFFGLGIDMSGDGSTLVVGAPKEDSDATGVDGEEIGTVLNSGAVYVFTKTGNVWSQQAYIKASVTGINDSFGNSVALSDDGNTLVVAAHKEDGSSTGINGDATVTSVLESGAAYVFVRSGNTWTQQAYIKASNAGSGDDFGTSVAISDSGNSIAVSAVGESSSAKGVNSNESLNNSINSGALYVFTRSGITWSQQAYIKASNTDINDRLGHDLSLSSDGNTLVASTVYEDGNAIGVNGDDSNNDAEFSGAAYVFTRTGSTWTQNAYLKASNTQEDFLFGISVTVSGDGNTIAVGSGGEESNATGIDGDKSDRSMVHAGAVYIFNRSGGGWLEGAYIKASNTLQGYLFGTGVVLNSDGNILAVASPGEASNAMGINGDQGNNGANDAGAVYIFTRDLGVWSQRSYVKAKNTGNQDDFGGESTNGADKGTIAISNDGETLAVGAAFEDGGATGVNTSTTVFDQVNATGAVYLY
jgi:hypothetical protein